MKEKRIGQLRSNDCIKRYENNPIMSAEKVPYKSNWVFNSSVIKHDGKYVMVFRNDYIIDDTRPDRVSTNFGIAFSNDGIEFQVQPEPILDIKDIPYFSDCYEDFTRGYDPRLAKIDGRIYMSFTAESEQGPRAAITVTDDFKQFEVIDVGMPCSRNTLLFPEKINGMYYRLERPFWEMIDHHNTYHDEWLGAYFHMWISRSPDLIHWGGNRLLLKVEDVPFANIKIGGGPIPIKTDEGWLIIIHAVDYDPARGKNGVEDKWIQRYTMGVVLLDLHNPYKIIGMCKEPLMVPENDYEINNGFRNNVIFPTATVLEDDDELKIYYGAADAVTCLATANMHDLIALCK